ncbi:shikimate dehydrogenase [Patescibacteria group bacterium]
MLNSKTKLCCLIGNPVKHSLSPEIHNAGYKALDLNFSYLAFKVNNLNDAIKGIKALEIYGISVTVPHKIKIIKYLDKIDKNAKEIGAVNTIINYNNYLKGFNSDCQGAIKAIMEKTTLQGKKIVLLGAGGAARAIAVGLKNEHAKITILNRTINKARKLANFVKAKKYAGLNNMNYIKSADILINATSIGMSPSKNITPVLKEFLHPKLVVFDIVYNPKETRLIKEAKSVGCKIIYGYKMLLYQAVMQFELFTKQKAPVAVMEKKLLNSLK